VARSPVLSLIVPTRKRPEKLRQFLASLIRTANAPDMLEVVVVIDSDDLESQEAAGAGLAVKKVIVPPGLPMGALNGAGYEASSGRYLMLLNDDVTARTPAWDTQIQKCFQACPDEILLVHVNDTLLEETLCTFPVVSRTFCELAGGICPRHYMRYRIDDHVEDVFNLLGLLGERRSVYLPEVVFEHTNFVEQRGGRRRHVVDQSILAIDAPRFEALAPARKELAVRLKAFIDKAASPAREAVWRSRLEAVVDPFALRVPGRLRVLSQTGPRAGEVRVTVAVITADGAREEVRTCLDAIRAYSRNAELIVLDGQRGPDWRAAAMMNRVLQTATTDYVAFVEDDAVVGPGWLDALLQSLTGNVAVVSPLHRPAESNDACGGLVFQPDGSGRHGRLLADADGPRHILSFCGGSLLLDRHRCRHHLFDEAYQQAFFDIDYGLRLWEAGQEVAASPHVVVTHLHTGPCGAELDRQRFAGRWLESGRLRQLQTQVWWRYAELQNLLSLAPAADDLLTRRPSESLSAFDRRARRTLAALRRAPILRQALLDRALQRLGARSASLADTATAHLAWLVGLCGRPVLVEADSEGHRITLCERFFATPAADGPFDPQRYQRGGYRWVYAAEDLGVLRQRCRGGLLDPRARPQGTTWLAKCRWALAEKLRKARECRRLVGLGGLTRIACHKTGARLRRLLPGAAVRPSENSQ
jgi:glycosyltransferase involved in cell wall biosynthesis